MHAGVVVPGVTVVTGAIGVTGVTGATGVGVAAIEATGPPHTAVTLPEAEVGCTRAMCMY